MKLVLVTPAPPQSRQGNRVTALRWARFLRSLGHRVDIVTNYDGQDADILIALHARKSHPSIARFHHEHPTRPIILALTGTDVYGDIRTDHHAHQSLELATRMVILQPLARAELPEHLRDRARVIYQSVPPPRTIPPPLKQVFEVCVLGHLRPVKDPMRTALAARLLPPSSRIRVIHLGAALSDDMARAARQEQRENPRYRWLGERPRWQALRLLARSRLLVLTSQLEGGANVISEAVVAGVPVLASRISGSIGLLGEDYPGYFPYADTQALADLLHRTETDKAYYRSLKSHCSKLKKRFTAAQERASWNELLTELTDL